MFEQVRLNIEASQPEVGFVFVTVGFLAISALILWMVKTHESKLILLGLVTAVAGIGYSSMVAGGAAVTAPTLMRISFVLVLGGLACGSIPYLRRPDDGKLNVSKEADDEEKA